MALRLDGYIRVSRVGGREGEGYISPNIQREAIERYASELGGQVIAWQSDEDFSGGTVERPAFQATLERLRARETDGVVVMRIDRFARSVADGAAVVREIVGRDQVFAACHERMDPRTPEGQFMLNSFLNNAELFLNQTKAGWWTAKSRAIARGAHIGPTPIGYLRTPKGDPRSGVLSPHPVYGAAMSELFRRAAVGDVGPSALARWMTARAPRDGAPWQPSEVRRWLRNRVYLGEVKYGELVNTQAHKPLTDSETWKRCQVEPGVQRVASSPFLLSGLVRCANCRYSMGGFSHGGSGSTRVYRCGRCEEASVVTAERLEGFIVGLAQQHMDSLVLRAAGDTDLAGAEQEAESAAVEVRTYLEDVNARRLVGEDAWQHGLSVRVTERNAKHSEVEELRSRVRLVSVTRRLNDLSLHELRSLLSGLIRTVFVRRRERGAAVEDRTLIVWADDTRALDLPAPHRSGPFEPLRW